MYDVKSFHRKQLGGVEVKALARISWGSCFKFWPGDSRKLHISSVELAVPFTDYTMYSVSIFNVGRWEGSRKKRKIPSIC